jgi:hypothetical protein
MIHSFGSKPKIQRSQASPRGPPPRDPALRLINQNPRFAALFCLDISRKLDMIYLALRDRKARGVRIPRPPYSGVAPFTAG